MQGLDCPSTSQVVPLDLSGTSQVVNLSLGAAGLTVNAALPKTLKVRYVTVKVSTTYSHLLY